MEELQLATFIQFDRKLVNVDNIDYFVSYGRQKGTDIVLSSGKRLTVDESIKDIKHRIQSHEVNII